MAPIFAPQREPRLSLTEQNHLPRPGEPALELPPALLGKVRQNQNLSCIKVR